MWTGVTAAPAAALPLRRQVDSTFLEEYGARPGDVFVQVHGFTQADPFTTGKTMSDLLAYIAMNGRRVHDHGRITR
jgi:hypothetical protein